MEPALAGLGHVARSLQRRVIATNLYLFPKPFKLAPMQAGVRIFPPLKPDYTDIRRFLF